MHTRGVSSPVGVVLILGITMATVVATVGGGAVLVQDSTDRSEITQMENAMSQFSSKASLVALDDTREKRFSMGSANRGDTEVREDAGHLRMYVEDVDGNQDELYNESYGAVVYQNGNTEVAYQGGGIWKKQGGHSRMVSPPEYHYQDQTLTFPVIRVTGTDRADGSIQGTIVQDEAATETLYPDQSDPDRVNPLEDGTVYVEIQSDYCHGWQSFFETRSDGRITQACDDEVADTVVVDLTVPFDEAFDNVLSGSSIETQGGDNPEPNEEGVTAPSMSGQIDSEIEECEIDGCEDLPESGTISDNGTYWVDGDHEFGDITFETDDTIDVVITGDLTGVDSLTVVGDGRVNVYLKGEFDLRGGPVVSGHNAEQFIVYIHSDADSFGLGGNAEYTGVIYAPNTDGTIDGSTDFTGAIVGDSVTINGQPSGDFEHDPSLADADLGITPDQNPITYLHVTSNEIEIRFD